MTNVSSDQQSERPPSRIVVVGASSGLGRCIGVHLGQNGTRVALLARREDELATACAEAGDSAVAIRTVSAPDDTLSSIKPQSSGGRSS